MQKYYVYIIECMNGSYYTGYTTDIQRRYQEHLQGSKKCKYTRSFPPKELAAYWCIEDDLSCALAFERHIKKLSKSQKKIIIKDENAHLRFFAVSMS